MSKFKVTAMNFKEWIEKMEERGSAEDPIVHNGKETTPTNLSYEFSPIDKIKGVRIQYRGGKPLRTIDGTCGGMLRERSRGFKPETKRRPLAWGC